MSEVVLKMSEVIPEEFDKSFIQSVLSISDEQIANLIKEFQYVPKEAPAARRKAIVKTYKPRHQDIYNFWTIMLLRGGNAKRLLAGADPNMTTEITNLFNKLKIKHSAIRQPGGMFSTWQVMSSFFDYGIVLIARSPDIQMKMLQFKNDKDSYAIDLPIPVFLTIPGAFHVIQHVDKDTVLRIALLVIAYNISVIYIKGLLAGKKQDKIFAEMTVPANSEARVRQLSFMTLASTSNNQNFNPEACLTLFNVLKVDMTKVTNKYDSWDFRDDPLKYIGDFVKHQKSILIK